MPTLKQATRPPDNLSDFSLVSQPPSSARPMPTPDPNSMPNYESLSLAPAPPLMSTDVDRQRQFYRHGVSQYRISPLPTKANLSTNASSRSMSNEIVAQALAGITPPDVESIASNPQTGNYDVQVTDRDTLITFSNSAGGIITLPGPNVSTAAFAQSTSASGASDVAVAGMTNGLGNLLFLTILSGRDGLTTTFTVSDTKGNRWKQLYTTLQSGGIAVSAWYAEGVVAGANTITITAIHTIAGSGVISVAIAEYSGIHASNALDAFSFGGNSSVAITPATSNDLVIFSTSAAASGGPKVAVAPWISRYNSTDLIIQDQIVSTPGTLITVINATSPAVTNGEPRALAAFKPRGFLANGFSAGWYTYIQNVGTGTLLLQSTSLIDNSLNSVSIGPGQGLLVVYDGTKWFTERGITLLQVQRAGVSQPQESKLNFSSSFTVTDNPGNGSTDVDVIPGLVIAMKINGIGVAADKEVDIKGLKDFAVVWGVSVNGVSDGG